jgi:membrane-associated phospholipid phosphatase
VPRMLLVGLCRPRREEAAEHELEGLLPSSAAAGIVLQEQGGVSILWCRRWMIWSMMTIISLMLGAAYDLKLSSTVANRLSPWAIALQDWGETPGYVSVCAASLTMQVGALTRHKSDGGDTVAASPNAFFRRPSTTMPILVLVSALTLHRATGSLSVAASLLAALLPAAVAAAVAVLCSLTAQQSLQSALGSHVHPLIPALEHLVLLFCLAGGAIEGTKFVWGRARPRMVFASVGEGYNNVWPSEAQCRPAGQYECAFSPWWAPQGPRHGLHSFPSGHTFCAWLLLPIAMRWTELRTTPAATPVATGAAPTMRRGIRERGVVWVAVVGFGVAVMTSRVVVGAHWLSDVCTAASITWGVALFLWSRT